MSCTDTETLTEWLDALSIQGYLLKRYSMNFLFGEFIQTNQTDRYFHLVIPTTKIQSHGIAKDEEIDQTTIASYKESGMEYLGKTCGYLLFRTNDRKIIEKNIDINGYLIKRNSLELLIIQLIGSLISIILLITNIKKLSITPITTGLFGLLLVFLTVDLFYGIKNVLTKRKQIKQPDAILPLYVISSIPQIIFDLSLLFICILVIVILIISDSQAK